MGVNQEVLFAKTLEQVRKTAKEQGNCISVEQVEEAFQELALSGEQLELVYDYLKKHKVGIGEPVDLDEYLSDEEMDYLEEYKKKLDLLEPISEGEKEAITLSAMAGEKDAQQKLIAVYLPQVLEISKLYAGQGVLMEDLIGEANLALTQAVRGLGCVEAQENIYDEVSGFLGKAMMDAMETLINEEADEKNADQQMADKVNRVADVAQELYDDLKRKVSPEEICANSELTLEEVSEAMRLSGNLIDTIEMEKTNDDNGQ